MIANYLNQQKHFVCSLFDPPYLEANIIMFAEFAINLGQLAITLPVKIHIVNLFIPSSQLQLGEPGPKVKTKPEFPYSTYSSEAASAPSLIRNVD